MINNYNNYILEKRGSPDKVKEYLYFIENKINKLNVGLNNFKLNLFDFDFDININIHINKLFNEDNYHGDFNIFDFLNDVYQINLDIKAKDINSIDYNKIFSIIQHELTHIYEILVYKGDSLKSTFNKIPIINSIKNIQSNNISDFTSRLYYSLEHELNATVSMIQYYLYRLGTRKYEDLKNQLDNYEPYKNILYLKNFDYKSFIDNFNREELLILTNIINKEFKYKEITINELEKYYKKWDRFFKSISNKYLKKINRILKYIVLKNEKFEYHCYSSIPLYDDYSYKNYINNNYNNLITELFENFKKEI
jgi:hypothetical protein